MANLDGAKTLKAIVRLAAVALTSPLIMAQTLPVTLGPTATDTPTPEITSSPTPSPEPTAELTDTPMPESTAEPSVTATPTDNPTDTPTETTWPTPTPTETPYPTATPTVTPTLTLVEFTGQARYQNRPPNNNGIQITILDGNRQLVSQVTTGADGRYRVMAPGQGSFWLVVAAPLHRRFEQGIGPDEALPEVELAGGDLDGDGCIGPLDVALLTAQYQVEDSVETDITNDGLTDVSDLAILAGNFNPDLCPQEPADTPTPTLPPTETPTPSSSATPGEVSPELSEVRETATPIPPEATGTSTPESTSESGAGGDPTGVNGPT